MSNFGGVDKPRFSFYKSRRNHGDRSRMNLELVSFFFFFFFVLDGWSSFGTARLEICNNSRGGNEIIRYRVTGNNVDNMTSMSVVLLDSCAKQNGLCKLESKPWSGRTQFFTRNSIYPRGQILDQWLDQFIGIDLFSTNNSGARRRFKGG